MQCIVFYIIFLTKIGCVYPSEGGIFCQRIYACNYLGIPLEALTLLMWDQNSKRSYLAEKRVMI